MSKILLILLTCVFLLGACGHKGGLYMPDEKSQPAEDKVAQ